MNSIINNFKISIKSISIKILLLLLVASFALWGVGDIFRGGNDPTIATVGNIKIKSSEFLSEYRNSINRFQSATKQEVNEELLKAIGMPNNVLSEIINKTYLDFYSKTLNLAVNKEYILKSIADNPNFKDQLGSFNKDLFNYFLQIEGMTEEEYINKLKTAIIREQLLKTFLHVSKTPNILLNSIYLNKKPKEQIQKDMGKYT